MEILSSILIIVLFTGFVKLATVLQVLQYGLGLRGVGFSVVMLVFAFILSILSVSSTLSDGDFKSLLHFETKAKSLESHYEKFRPFLEANADKETTLRINKVTNKRKSNESAGKITSSKNDATLLLSFTLTQIQSAFKLAVIILLPLLAIDLLVVHAFQLLDVKSYEPIMLALPLKLLLLYVINGFTLISEKLLNGFNMMPELDTYILEDFYRLLLLIGFPMVIGVALSGLLASFIQSCIGISEISISYTFRVIALVLIIIF